MNTILLQPTDVLFFRNGRPMGGAYAGHGAAWPLPTVVNHAFHAALHRAGTVFKDVHPHRRGRDGDYEEARDRRFGSLVTTGPFPVRATSEGHTWFFPRPADADDTGTLFLQRVSIRRRPFQRPGLLHQGLGTALGATARSLTPWSRPSHGKPACCTSGPGL